MFKSRDLMFLTFATLSLSLACSNAEGDGDSPDDGSSAVGGYTGLGNYTGVSGVYGSGGKATGAIGGATGSATGATGGATGSAMGGSAGVPTATGGTSASTTTGSSLGGKSSVGGATSGTASGGTSTTGGTTARGGTSSTRGGTSSAGGSSAGSSWTWPDTYNPNGTALVATGEHRPGVNCMTSSCHGPTTGSRAFAFGGTVYQANGTTAASHVEIAIVSGTKTYTTYSATNGNFWIPLATATNLDWTTAKVHLRTATGELTKPAGAEVGAACNSCHTSGSRITTP
jgi:hypothetical protein